MNKGMIMEVKKSYAITLNDEGIMEKIKSKPNMEIGQKIFYFEDDVIKATSNGFNRHNNLIKAFGSIAALFLLVFTFFSTIKYDQAYAVVSLDINPSIQIEADSKQRIIKVEGVNDDGKNIDFSDIKDISLDEGIQKVKEKLVEKKYLDSNKEVLVGVFIKNGDNVSYEQDLQKAIRSTFDTEVITYVKADKEEVDEAKTEGISLGRYKAKETATVDEATKNKIGTAPVKEITALIKDKDNVIQWEAKDEQKATETPVADTNPEVKTDKPAADISGGSSKNEGKDKPVINVPSENGDSNANTGTDKENTPNSPKNNDILELEPEKPVDAEKDKPSKAPDDSSIIIAPDNGTIENKPTSGKIPEEPAVKPSSGTTNPVEVKPEEIVTKTN